MKNNLSLLLVLFLSLSAFAENPAMVQAQNLLTQLALPTISSDNIITYQQQYWNLLGETGPEYTTYGSITGGPILSQNLNNMPSVSTGTIVTPEMTAWKLKYPYLPTNDWFENIAAFPTLNTNSDNGYHYLTQENNGILFNLPASYDDWGAALHSMIIVSSWDKGFKLGGIGYEGKPYVIKWKNDDTGNLVRQLYYSSHFWVYVNQGGLFQGASYFQTTPDLGLNLASATRSVVDAFGTVKYRLVVGSMVYLVYGNSAFVQGAPYTGLLNVAAIYNDANETALEALCDKHCHAVIVKGQGTLLPNGTYSFQYICSSLNGSPTSYQPLILLKAHHMNSLVSTKTYENKNISHGTLTGPVGVFSGSTYVFKPAQPRSIDPSPNLANGNPPLTVAQATALCEAGGPLPLEIANILANYNFSSTVYGGGKSDYRVALTLDYGAKALTIAGEPISTIMPIYQRMCTVLAKKLNLYVHDTEFGGIVSSIDDYGDHSDYNDHIVQYGYDLMSFAILKAFEDQYVPAAQRLMSKQVTLPGYQSFTYQDMADILAADIGEMSNQDPFLPVTRNLDIYIGHSWLSGFGGKNTESESEAVLGSWAVAYWLQVRGASADQQQTALTRLALENESLNLYNHIGDPSQSVFINVGPIFTPNHNVVSITWGNWKLGDETYWGLNWDRIFACEFMPASANMMDTMLDNNPVFAKRAADYILANWIPNFDTGNTIQSVLVPIVAKVYGSAMAEPLIDYVASQNMFDEGTSAFILRYINRYADNELSSP